MSRNIHTANVWIVCIMESIPPFLKINPSVHIGDSGEENRTKYRARCISRLQ